MSYIYRYGVPNAGLVGGLKLSYDRVKPVCRYSKDHLFILHHRPDPVAISRQHYLWLPGLECLQDSFSAGPAPATEHGLHSYTSFLGGTEQYTGYKIKRKDTIIGMEPLDLPPLTFRTKAFWFLPTSDSEQYIKRSGLDLAGGLHGVEHAIFALMPLHVLCDRWDIGGLSSPAFGEKNAPMVFVYDGYEGGIGLAEKAYEILPDMFSSAYELVRDCGCDEGCPSCIFSPKCGNDNQPLDKEAAVLILNDLCNCKKNKEYILTSGESGQVFP